MKTATSAARPGHPEVRISPPSYELKAKAPLTGRDLVSALAGAESSLQRHRSAFLEALTCQAGNLQAAFEDVERTHGAAAALAKLNREAHELGGLGTTFGYSAMSEVCAMLCAFIEDRDRLSEGAIEVVRLHVSAIALAVRERLDGQTPEGKAVLEGLRKVIVQQAA